MAAKFDLNDAEVLENPYPTYAKLRDAGRVVRGGPAQWVVTRYADVFGLMSDRRLSGNFSGEYHRLSIGEGPASEFFRRIVLNQDPPEHTRLRRLMGQAISPSFVRDLGPRIAKIVDELLDPVADGRRFDAVTDLGYPLPLRVLCDIVGIASEDESEIGRRAAEVSKAFAAFLPVEDRPATHGSVVWLYDYIRSLLEQRRRHRGDDLLSRLLAAEDNGDHLSELEIIENVVFTLFAGFETSTSLVATGCIALGEHPDQFLRLRTDPGLVPTAVEEFLRYDAPIQVKMRLVTEPFEIDGTVLRAGRVAVLLLGSANHDDRQFHHPEALDVGRPNNLHVSFGGGHHRCIGAALARLEASIAFEQLARRFSALAPAGPAQPQRRGGFRGYDAVPLEAIPA